jgi:hypothetical protein
VFAKSDWVVDNCDCAVAKSDWVVVNSASNSPNCISKATTLVSRGKLGGGFAAKAVNGKTNKRLVRAGKYLDFMAALLVNLSANFVPEL